MEIYTDETSRMYKTIIKEVIQKLKTKSEKGQLQMSESEIQQFKDLWDQKLELMKGELPTLSNTKNIQFKEDYDQVNKKVKLNEQIEVKSEIFDQISVKQEEDDKEMSFESEEESVAKKEIPDYEVKTQDFEKKKHEKEREKTLFDKIRELDRLSKEKDDQKDYSDDDSDHPKQYSAYIFGQKVNAENTMLSRIKPNKVQKANLENILVKLPKGDAFICSASLSFNFKTNQK